MVAKGSPHPTLGAPEDAMLLIGTLLPEASEEEAGKLGATLGPVGHFLEALGYPGFPQRQPPPEGIKPGGWCFRGRMGRDSWEVDCGVGSDGGGWRPMGETSVG